MHTFNNQKYYMNSKSSQNLYIKHCDDTFGEYSNYPISTLRGNVGGQKGIQGLSHLCDIFSDSLKGGCRGVIYLGRRRLKFQLPQNSC